ncbi:MAG: DUF494 domain-containing protein [Gammaproteobacteria bacterium]|nr:MAG: DUF494 domain-containing protein [Gammaproteobacteria bacterium]
MTTGSVLDILIYVFDRYMLEETSTVPHRQHLARDLEQAGFGRANVERALDWLTDLAFGQERARPEDARRPGSEGALRIFTDSELVRLSSESRARDHTATARARDRAAARARGRRARHRAAEMGGAHGALERAGRRAGGGAARRADRGAAQPCSALRASRL